MMGSRPGPGRYFNSEQAAGAEWIGVTGATTPLGERLIESFRRRLRHRYLTGHKFFLPAGSAAGEMVSSTLGTGTFQESLGY